MEQQPKQPDKLDLLKATAINAAMVEILKENRAELLRRAVEKLRAFGITVKESEISGEAAAAGVTPEK